MLIASEALWRAMKDGHFLRTGTDRHMGELERNVAAADKNDAFGTLREMEEIIAD